MRTSEQTKCILFENRKEKKKKITCSIRKRSIKVALATLLPPEHINTAHPPLLFLDGSCSKVGRACAVSVLFFVEGKCGMARDSALGDERETNGSFHRGLSRF